MADAYLVEPDVGFIKEVRAAWGADLKKCFQCATCSVACPISPDTKPFPRKEMIAASWGLKDRLVGNRRHLAVPQLRRLLHPVPPRRQTGRRAGGGAGLHRDRICHAQSIGQNGQRSQETADSAGHSGADFPGGGIVAEDGRH